MRKLRWSSLPSTNSKTLSCRSFRIRSNNKARVLVNLKVICKNQMKWLTGILPPPLNWIVDRTMMMIRMTPSKIKRQLLSLMKENWCKINQRITRSNQNLLQVLPLPKPKENYFSTRLLPPYAASLFWYALKLISSSRMSLKSWGVCPRMIEIYFTAWSTFSTLFSWQQD